METTEERSPAVNEKPTAGPPPPSKLDLPGYEVLALIGSGGMGTVYQARELKSRRLVAVKLLRTDSRVSRTIERFVREIEALGRVKHPNLVAALDAGYTGGAYYYVMEFVEGRSTEQMVRQGPLEEARCLDILRQISGALDALHRHGIIHRDLKPSNILIMKDGTAKLCDLGISKAVDESDEDQAITSEGVMLGTPRYMSPEQIRGETLDGRSDLYSLGAAAFHLATGRPPFEAASGGAIVAKHLTEAAPDPRGLRPELSRGFSALILKLLEKSPAHRFQTAPQMGEAARALIEGQEAGFAGPLERMRNHPRAVAAVAGAAVLLVVLLLLAVGGGGEPPRTNPPPKDGTSSGPENPTPRHDPDPPPPPPDLETERARAHEDARSRVNDLLDAWRTTRDSSKVSEILTLIEYNLQRFRVTGFEGAWREERENFVREARAWIAAEWAPKRDSARAALAKGDFAEAEAAIEGLPRALRELPPGTPTEAEVERRALAQQIEAAVAASIQRDRAALLKADVAGALAILARMEATLPESSQKEVEDLRQGIEKWYFEIVDSKPLTSARAEEFRRELAALAAKPELSGHAAPMLAELTRRRQTALAQAGVKLSAAHSQVGLAAHFKNREWEAARNKVAKILTDPSHALAFEGDGMTPESAAKLGEPLGGMLRELQERRRAVETALAAAARPEVRTLLSDLRASLLVEELCFRAWVGVEASDSAEWKNLHLPILWTATSVARLTPATGRQFACRVTRSIGAEAEFTIAPVSAATLSAEDVARAARRSYPSGELADKDPLLPLAASLLYWFAGDAAAARRSLEAVKEAGALAGVEEYVEKIRTGRSGGDPSQGKPAPGPAAPTRFKVNAREMGARKYQLSYGFADASELEDFVDATGYFDVRSNFHGTLKKEVRKSDLTVESSGVFAWAPELEGDVLTEIEFKLEGGDATSLAFLIHFDRSATPRQEGGRRAADPGYALVFTLRPGRTPTGSMELRKRGRAMDSQPYRLILGQSYVLRFNREGRKLTVSLREQGTSKIYKLEADDDEWGRGRLGIAVANGKLELRRVRLTATVTQAWAERK